MKILDIDETVISWNKKHGIRIPYEHNGLNKIYIPDFVIIYNNKTVLEEIKGWEEESKKNQKFLVLNDYCKKNNFTPNILTFKNLDKISRTVFGKSIKKLRKEFKLCVS